MQFVDPKVDIAFRRLFGRESNKELTMSLVNSILGLKGRQALKRVQLLNPHLLPESIDLRESIVDILCEDQRDQKYIVELQVLKPVAFDKRVLYYASKTYADQMLKSQKYKDLKKVYFLGILNHEMFKYTQAYKTKHQVRDSVTYDITFSDIEFHIIELPKFQKQEHELETTEDWWIYFMKTAAQADHIPEAVSEPEIQKAYNEMNQFNWTPAERESYQRSFLALQDRDAILEQAVLDSLEKGKKEGEKKGRKEERRAIAKELYETGMDFDSIVGVTKLTQQEITDLFNSI
jgi:predicted transposase/invertase (TIGR01784 family)